MLYAISPISIQTQDAVCYVPCEGRTSLTNKVIAYGCLLATDFLKVSGAHVVITPFSPLKNGK